MLEEILLPCVLALLMFGLGMHLRIGDFVQIARRKTMVSCAIFSVLLIMPVIAFGLGYALQLSPAMHIGLVLLAACPGGMFSNVVTHAARGNLALSICLTVGSSFVYLLTIPWVVWSASSLLSGTTQRLQLSLFKVFIDMLLVVLLPIVAGMLLHLRAPHWCARHQAHVRHFSSAVIVAIFIGIAIDQFDHLRQSGTLLLTAVLLLNLLGWAWSALLCWRLACQRDEFIAIAVEHSIRQEGTGVFIAVTLIGSREMAMPLLANSALGLSLSALILFFLQWHKRAVLRT